MIMGMRSRTSRGAQWSSSGLVLLLLAAVGLPTVDSFFAPAVRRRRELSKPPRHQHPKHHRSSTALAAEPLALDAAADAAATAAAKTDLDALAQVLGYVVGAGSLLLYAPIICRVASNRGGGGANGNANSAQGLALSTWWLKLSAYTATDLYCASKGFPLSTFVETAVITVEAAALVGLVAWRQGRLFDARFAAALASYAAVTGWAVLAPAPPEVLALAQGGSAALSTAALVPQLLLNAERGDPGGYSPLTAGLACAGCSIRLFTTNQLAGGDPVLFYSFALALAFNGALLAQILFYGVVVQRRPLLSLLAADFAEDTSSSSSQ